MTFEPECNWRSCRRALSFALALTLVGLAVTATDAEAARKKPARTTTTTTALQTTTTTQPTSAPTTTSTTAASVTSTSTSTSVPATTLAPSTTMAPTTTLAPSTGTPSTAKPSDASTGPRIPTAAAAGGNLSGTHSGKRFTGSVTANGPLTLTDCVIEGALTVYNGPVILDHCDVLGWTGVMTDNLDPQKAIFTARFTKFVGPTNNDAMRIGPANVWGDHTRYVNTLIEDSIVHSPYNTYTNGDHLDVLQFGGGNNSTFNRVVFSYAATTFLPGATSHINNGINNRNVVFNQLWLEGGPMSYTVAGHMTVNTCVINRSTRGYGYVYPAPGTKLNNCTDELGQPIAGT